MSYLVYYKDANTGKNEATIFKKKTGKFGALSFKKHLQEVGATKIEIRRSKIKRL